MVNSSLEPMVTVRMAVERRSSFFYWTYDRIQKCGRRPSDEFAKDTDPRKGAKKPRETIARAKCLGSAVR